MKLLRTLALLTLCAATSQVMAQQQGMDHAAASASPMAANEALTDGVVRKIDKSAKKITLKHGEIKNLDMMPMTMVFRVQDPALLERVKVGDKVRFTADEVQGALVLMTIEPVAK